MGIRKPSQALEFNVAAEINVTPMIDVMLVLLIIFMVVTPAMAGAVLPRATHAEYQPGKHPTLIIDATGRMKLDVNHRTVPVGERTLRSQLASTYANRENDHVLYLKADRNLEYTRVLSALEDARSADITRVAAITESPRRDPHR